jgi:hypothetical protein
MPHKICNSRTFTGYHHRRCYYLPPAACSWHDLFFPSFFFLRGSSSSTTPTCSFPRALSKRSSDFATRGSDVKTRWIKISCGFATPSRASCTRCWRMTKKPLCSRQVRLSCWGRQRASCRCQGPRHNCSAVCTHSNSLGNGRKIGLQ